MSDLKSRPSAAPGCFSATNGQIPRHAPCMAVHRFSLAKNGSQPSGCANASSSNFSPSAPAGFADNAMKITANGIQIELEDTGGEGRPVVLLVMGLGRQLIA